MTFKGNNFKTENIKISTLNNQKEVQYNKPTKIEELSDQLIPVPEPGNLTSYLPLSAAPEISQSFGQALSMQICIQQLDMKQKQEAKERQ